MKNISLSGIDARYRGEMTHIVSWYTVGLVGLRLVSAGSGQMELWKVSVDYRFYLREKHAMFSFFILWMAIINN